MKLGNFLSIFRNYFGRIEMKSKEYLDYSINLFMSKDDDDLTDNQEDNLHYYLDKKDDIASKILNGSRDINKKYANLIIRNLDAHDFCEELDKIHGDSKNSLYNEFCTFIGKHIDYEDFEQEAIDTFSKLVNDIIKKDNVSLSEFHNSIDEKYHVTNSIIDIDDEGEYEDENFGSLDIDNINDYFEKIKNQYNKIRTLIYRNVKKSFEELYVNSSISYLRYKKNEFGSESLGSLKYENFNIKHLLEIKDNILIVGTGGIGKSMLLRFLLLDAINNYDKYNLIPVFINIRDYLGPDRDLETIISNELLTYGYSFYHSNYKKHLASGNILFLFDGLDEVGIKHKSSFDYDLSHFMNRYKNNIFVMSSREAKELTGYENFSIAHISPLNIEQSITLIKKLKYRTDEPEFEKSFIELVKSKLIKTHKDFIENPLLLSIMYMTYDIYGEIPHTLFKFYEMAYSVLSREHDSLKGGLREYKSNIDSEKFFNLFAEFCARTYHKEIYEFTDKDFKEYITKTEIYNDFKLNSDNIKYDLTTNLCLLYEDANLLFFTHRSFQEYFASQYFSKESESTIKKLFNFYLDTKDNVFDTDNMLLMLYETNPKLINRIIIYPYLTEKFNKWNECEYGEYAGYLIDEYHSLSYGLEDYYSKDSPLDSLLRYILKIYKIDNIDGYDELDKFDVTAEQHKECKFTKYYNVKSKFWDDDDDSWDTLEESIIDKDAFWSKYPPEHIGNVYTLDIYSCFERCYNDDFQSKFNTNYTTINSDEYPIKKQYNSLLNIFNKIQKEVSNENNNDIFKD